MAIIQAVNPPNFAPLSNRGKVWDFFPLGHYSLANGLTYWQEFTDPETDRTYSVDMVRLSFKVDPNGNDDIGSDVAEWWYCSTEADIVDYWPSCKPNQFQAVFTLYWGEWVEADNDTRRFDKDNAVSLTVGAGWISSDGRHDPLRGFVEFNPNKVGEYALETLCAFVRHFRVRFELARWDFALDAPMARKSVLMLKDARKYEAVISDSITTYLGQRNASGRVKVYDKQKEASATRPLTRVEVTYPRPVVGVGGIVQDPVRNYWPTVGTMARAAELAPKVPETGLALVKSLLALSALNQDVEPFLQVITDAKTRRKYKRLLLADVWPFPLEAWRWCALNALAWENPPQLALLLAPE